jgi:hypothetical protein
LQEIKSGKNTTSIFHVKEEFKHWKDEGVLEAQTGMAHAARFIGRVVPARLALERRLASSFRVRPHIY